MKSLAKVSLVILFGLSYLIILVAEKSEMDILLLAIITTVVFVFHIIVHNLKNSLLAIVMAIPLTLSILVFGVIFEAVSFMGRSHWLEDAVVNSLFFLNMVLFFNSIVALITYNDLLKLPFSTHVTDTIIVLKSNLEKGEKIFKRISFHTTNYYYLEKRNGFASKISIKAMSSMVVSLFSILYTESVTTSRTIHNRRKHLKI